jgi:hypothetical protein
VTVTLNLPPDIEHSLLAEAEARGVSLDALLEMLLRQFAAANQPDQPTTEGTIIQMDDGMWALHSGHPISAETVNDTIDALRRERDLSNLGMFR